MGNEICPLPALLACMARVPVEVDLRPLVPPKTSSRLSKMMPRLSNRCPPPFLHACTMSLVTIIDDGTISGERNVQEPVLGQGLLSDDVRMTRG